MVVFKYILSTHFDFDRTQKSLDEGVNKLKDIYASFEQVGIKDRSMIWNSLVTVVLSRLFPLAMDFFVGTLLRPLNFVICYKMPCRPSLLLPPARRAVAPMLVRTSRR